jgi:hypothetical protein
MVFVLNSNNFVTVLTDLVYLANIYCVLCEVYVEFFIFYAMDKVPSNQSVTT